MLLNKIVEILLILFHLLLNQIVFFLNDFLSVSKELNLVQLLIYLNLHEKNLPLNPHKIVDLLLPSNPPLHNLIQILQNFSFLFIPLRLILKLNLKILNLLDVFESILIIQHSLSKETISLLGVINLQKLINILKLLWQAKGILSFLLLLTKKLLIDSVLALLGLKQFPSYPRYHYI